MNTTEKQPAEVRIHINQQPYNSPNPTTGHALFVLGGIAHGNVLYREVDGDHEDELIPDGTEVIRLELDAHFHSGPKEIIIVVNGTKHPVVGRRISYDRLVALAFPMPPPGQNILYTITYRRGPRRNPEGEVLEGQTVKIKDGMIFNVAPTDKS